MWIPQVLVALIYAGALVVSARDHGRMESRQRVFWKDAAQIAVMVSLLAWGGFWSGL